MSDFEAKTHRGVVPWSKILGWTLMASLGGEEAQRQQVGGFAPKAESLSVFRRPTEAAKFSSVSVFCKNVKKMRWI